jgi:hypothetical protein
MLQLGIELDTAMPRIAMVEFASGRAVRKVIDETYLVDTFVQNSKNRQKASYGLYLSKGYLSSDCERFAPGCGI